jgi:predicted permease
MTPRLPFVVRLLLACVPLGDRRDDVESDLAELFDLRRRERGRLHAYWRLLGDLSSLVNMKDVKGVKDVKDVKNLGLFQDLRHGVRLFRKHPAVIGATVTGLALAIAVATTAFTLLNATLLRPYGMDDPASVVRVQMAFDQGIANAWPYHAFATLREHARTARLAASFRDSVGVGLSATEPPARADSLLFVTGDYLPMLGGRATVGRTLLPSDDEPGAPPVVVLQHRFWMSRFGGDQAIVGRTIWLSGAAVTVAGVLESSFTGPTNSPPSMWAPFSAYGAIARHKPLDRTSTAAVTITGRVNATVARAVAEQELSAIARGLPDLAMRSDSGVTVPVAGVRLDGASSPFDGAESLEVLAAIGLILLLVGLVLALACANVANLLLAGAAARAREIGMRLALGATRRRILRQLLSESLLIGLVAGAAGLLLSLWLVPIVAATDAETLDLRPDLTVLLFTIGISILAGAGAGLAPARHGSSGDLVNVLKAQGAHASSPPRAARLRKLFIGFQAAASILLLVTAALFIRAALHVVHVDFGFDASRLVTVAPGFPRAGFEAAAVEAYWRSALDRVRAIPSVEQATLASSPPFGGLVAIREVGRLKRGGLSYRLYENRTDEAYFTATGLRLLKGRSYTAAEVRADAPVAVVSESVVRDFFGDAEPIGASLSAVSDDLSTVTIVGVVAEAVTARARGRGNGTIYLPLGAAGMREARLLIRTVNPHAMVRDLDQILGSVDGSVRVTRTIMSRDVDEYLKETAVLAGLSGAVAGLALLLAVTGLYGVTTFVVGQRLWEMQVRRAIGASARDITRLLVRQHLTPVVVGLVAGLAVALAVVRILAPALSGVSPYDPAAIGGAVAVLLAAAGIAVLLPALRAAHADPAAVLRQP